MSLDRKISTEIGKIDDREWVPVYGIFQMWKDHYYGKPNILTSFEKGNLKESLIGGATLMAQTGMLVYFPEIVRFIKHLTH